MAAAVRKRGVKVFDRTMVVDLLTNNGRVEGATAVNTRTGEFIVFKAKAVVIAAGDLLRHYNSTTPSWVWKYKMAGHNTCPASSSGDGLAAAYRAGADLSCMEMMRQGVIRDILCMQPGHFYHNDGIAVKTFTWKGEEEQNLGFRGPPDYLKYLEFERKGLLPLYHSLEHLPDDFQKRIEVHFADETMLRLKLSQDRGFNPRTHRYQISCNRSVMRYRGTGIAIDENFESSLRGVYAIGDCSDTSGMGAGGAAISGFIVGDNIHKYINEVRDPVVDEAIMETQKQTALAPLAVKDGVEPMELECAIRYICDEYAGATRSEGMLREGLRRLGSLKNRFLPKLMAPNPHYLMRCLEVRNILDMAELHLQASLERKETRGEYIRLDYPERDPSLDNKRICQRMEKGQPVLTIKATPELKPEYAKEKK
jgi:succinate dehydrogenase/fumarate reductase flavoprotein subunit